MGTSSPQRKPRFRLRLMLLSLLLALTCGFGIALLTGLVALLSQLLVLAFRLWLLSSGAVATE